VYLSTFPPVIYQESSLPYLANVLISHSFLILLVIFINYTCRCKMTPHRSSVLHFLNELMLWRTFSWDSLPIVSSSENIYPNPLFMFKLAGLLMFSYKILLHTLIKIPYKICSLKIVSPNQWVFFSLSWWCLLIDDIFKFLYLCIYIFTYILFSIYIHV
jgi:hypothetical protein